MNADTSTANDPAFQGESSAPARNPAPEGGASELSADELKSLFVVVCCVLPFDALRLKPREKSFFLSLATDSFAYGREYGPIGISEPVRGKPQTGKWCARFSTWRGAEIWKLLCDWRRAGWVVVDVTEGLFRLAPDRVPGWADALHLWHAESQGQCLLSLLTETDLHKEFAKISQAAAKYAAKKPHTFENAKISHTLPSGPGVPVPNVPAGTSNRSQEKRINVPNVGTKAAVPPTKPVCENFAASPPPPPTPTTEERGIIANRLRERVRKFVGEKDWTAEQYWNYGVGKWEFLFTREAATVRACLDYCEASIQEGVVVKKTKAQLFWWELQRMRREKTAT